MAYSEQFKRTVELGKKLVQELELDRSPDTLGRWMAHHLADLINQAEQGPESDRNERRRECRSAILELWEHMYSIRTASNPFLDLESIVETIRALDPGKPGYFYQTKAQEVADNPELPQSAKEWLNLSREIDYNARLLIHMCFERVIGKTSGKLRELIELASDTGAYNLPVSTFIYQLTEQYSGGDLDTKKIGRKELEDRLERLNSMEQRSKILSIDIQNQLDELDKI